MHLICTIRLPFAKVHGMTAAHTVLGFRTANVIYTSLKEVSFGFQKPPSGVPIKSLQKRGRLNLAKQIGTTSLLNKLIHS